MKVDCDANKSQFRKKLLDAMQKFILLAVTFSFVQEGYIPICVTLDAPHVIILDQNIYNKCKMGSWEKVKQKFVRNQNFAQSYHRN